MDDNALLERLAALENTYQQDTQKKQFDDFMGQYGSKFGGHQGIGQSFMDRIGGMGVDATEEVVEQLLGELRQDIQTLSEAVGPARAAQAAQDMPSLPEEAGGALPPLPPDPGAVSPASEPLPQEEPGASAPAPETAAPPPDAGATPPPSAGSEPPLPEKTVSDEKLKDIADPAASAALKGDELGGIAGAAIGGAVAGPVGAAVGEPIGDAVGDALKDVTEVSDEGVKEEAFTPEEEAALDEVAALVAAGQDPGIEGLDEGDLAWLKEWGEKRAGMDKDPSDPAQAELPRGGGEVKVSAPEPFLPAEDENDILASVLSKRY